jgi:hypothetical protein
LKEIALAQSNRSECLTRAIMLALAYSQRIVRELGEPPWSQVFVSAPRVVRQFRGPVMQRFAWIIAAFVLALVLWLVYLKTTLPAGVEAKGPSDWLPWLSLAGSIVSLLTGIVGLIGEIRKLRSARNT